MPGYGLPALLVVTLAACGGGGAGPTEAPVSGPEPILSALNVSVGSLDQPFQASQRSYSATQPFLVAEIEVRVDVPDDAKRLRVAGRDVTPGQPSGPLPLSVGSNSIEIEVERPDPPAIGTYRLDVQRLASDSVVTTGELREGNGLPAGSRQVQMALSGDRLAVTTAIGSQPMLPEVRVFRREGEVWIQEALLAAPDPERPGNFGTALALHDDVLVVGAPTHDEGSAEHEGDVPLVAGAVYVFRRHGEHWEREASLFPPEPHWQRLFGRSVAVNGRHLVVGAPMETVVDGGVEMVFAGAIYVFSRIGESWELSSRITAPEPGPWTFFGYSLTLDTAHLITAAPFEGAGVPEPCTPESGTGPQPCPISMGAGAVYVHAFEDGTVAGAIRLDSPETGDEGGLGLALAHDGARIAASAPMAEPSGAVVVWRAAEGEWLQDAVLRPPSGVDSVGFGQSLALAHGVLAVGAALDADGATGFDATPIGEVVRGNGAVVLYERSESQWMPPLLVKPPQALERQQFGEAVGLEDGRLVVSQRPLAGGFAFPVTTEADQALFFMR